MKKTKVLAVICAISMFVGGCQSDPKKQIIGTWEHLWMMELFWMMMVE